MKRFSVRQLVLAAVFAALTAVCSWISIPVFAVPFTLQTFGVELALFCLGGRTGFLSVSVYLLIGIAGVPVFSGFNSGAGYLLGPTGGYILGFLAMALMWMLLESRFSGNRGMRLGGMFAALAACYFIGTGWFYFFYGRAHDMSVSRVLSICIVPFLVPDAVKLILAELVSERVRRAVRVSL